MQMSSVGIGSTATIGTSQRAHQERARGGPQDGDQGPSFLNTQGEPEKTQSPWEKVAESPQGSGTPPGRVFTPGGSGLSKPAPSTCIPDRCILNHVMNSLTCICPSRSHPREHNTEPKEVCAEDVNNDQTNSYLF